jgi:hypothetical protein
MSFIAALLSSILLLQALSVTGLFAPVPLCVAAPLIVVAVSSTARTILS